MASVHLRQQVLDQLYHILKEPLAYRNRDLLFTVNSPRDGLVSVDSVYSMTTVLKPCPLEYVKHCIPRDSEQRFRWNSDFTRVGLKENAQYYETNAFGYIDEESDNDTSVYPGGVQPVIYEDGKFYIDDEHTRSQEPPAKQFFEYDKLDIKPIGELDAAIIPKIVCYNCSKIGHHFRACPQPKNYSRIKRYSERLFVNIERSSSEPGKLSPQLREALGMSEEDEPPYYSRMRYYGYPPGYLSYTSKSDDAEAPLLKVYDGKYVIHTRVQVQSKPQQEVLTHSVEYPGLYTTLDVNHTKENTETEVHDAVEQTQQSSQQQWDEYYYNYIYQYQYSYYNAEPQPLGIAYSQLNSNKIHQAPPPESLGDQHILTNDDQNDDMDISSDDEG